MQNLNTVLRAIPAPDADSMARAQQHIDGLLKPPGSLGRLEALAVQLAGMPGLGGQPQVAKKALLVMCADHGVWDEGVAISPKAVTAIQAANMTRGTTGVCVLAAQAGAKVHVIDVGIDSEPLPGVVNMRVARGCGNIARGPAMSREQGQELLLEVMRYTRALAQEGVTLFGVGELGMANTTPAAAIVSVLTGSDAQEVVGIGANLPLAKVGNKVEVVRRAIAVNQPDPNDGLDVLSKVGGFDLLGMTGVMLGGGVLWAAGGAGWLSLLRGGAGGVSDSAGGETVSDPVPLFGGEGGAYRAGAPGSRTVSQYGHASGRRQRRGAGDADRRGGLRDVPSHGHAGGKQYCVTEGVSRRWGRQWPFPFSAEVLPAAETKNTLEGVCNVGCGGRI